MLRMSQAFQDLIHMLEGGNMQVIMLEGCHTQDYLIEAYYHIVNEPGSFWKVRRALNIIQAILLLNVLQNLQYRGT